MECDDAMECADWYDREDRRLIAGYLLIIGDLVEHRTKSCRKDIDRCEIRDTEECPWAFWGVIDDYIHYIISSLTPEDIEYLEALEAKRERLDIHSPKAEPMKTAVLYDLLKVSEEELMAIKDDMEFEEENVKTYNKDLC